MNQSSPDRDLMLFDSMMLLSVLSTAADVHNVINRRRAGQDPRAQEKLSDVRSYLSGAIDRLEEGFVRLFMQHVCISEHEEVRQMDQLLLVRRLSRELHLVHQRLLSLYPGVPGEQIEDVRSLEQRCEAFPGSSPEYSVEDLTTIVDRGLRTTSQLRRALDSNETASGA